MSGSIAALFQRLTQGVYVVGVAHGEVRNAFTAAWVMQVSFDPLLLALSINPHHSSYGLLKEGRAFSVNVLKKGQLELAALPHVGYTTGRQVRTARSYRRLFRLDCCDRRPAVRRRRRFRHRPTHGHATPGGGEKHDSGAAALFIADIRGHHLSRGARSAGRAQRWAYGGAYADAPAAGGMDWGRPQDRPQHACERRPIGEGKTPYRHRREQVAYLQCGDNAERLAIVDTAKVRCRWRCKIAAGGASDETDI